MSVYRVAARHLAELKDRQIGSCGVCGHNKLKVVNNKLSLHGYKRPGYGYIEGNCPGSRETPLELAPDTLDIAIRYARSALAAEKADHDRVSTADTFNNRHTYKPKLVSRADFGSDAFFERARKEVLDTIAYSIKNLEGRVVEFAELRASWEPSAVRDVQELVTQKQERSDKVRTDRLLKYEALVESTKERLLGIYTKMQAAEPKLKAWVKANKDLPGTSHKLDKGAALYLDVSKRAITLLDWFDSGVSKLVQAYPGHTDKSAVIVSMDIEALVDYLNVGLKPMPKLPKYDFELSGYSVSSWPKPYWWSDSDWI